MLGGSMIRNFVVGLGCAVGAMIPSCGSVAFAAMLCNHHVVSKGTENFVGQIALFGEMCFHVYNLQTNLPARVRFKDLINGKPRDLDFHTGVRCLTNYTLLYRVYITALNEDVRGRRVFG